MEQGDKGERRRGRGNWGLKNEKTNFNEKIMKNVGKLLRSFNHKLY